VLYQLLNRGRRPFLPDYPAPIFPRDKKTALERRMKGEALPPLKDVPQALNDIVQRACAYDRKARFTTAAELRTALEAFANAGDWDRTIGTVGAFDGLPEDSPRTGATVGAFDGPDAGQTEATVGSFDALPPPPAKKKKPSAVIIAGIHGLQSRCGQ